MNYNLQKNLAHFGTILYRLSFISVFCVLGLLVSEILAALILLVLLMIALATLFTLFLDENFRKLFDVTGSFGELIAEVGKYLPLAAAISLGLLLVSIIFLLPDYKNRTTRSRIIISIFMAIILGIILIIGLTGGVSNA